jgi:membrane protein YqaA with SNARE-associated domain
VKFRELLAELRDALTVPTKGSLVRAILFLVALLVIVVGLSFLISYYFPSEEEFKTEFIPRYGKYAYPAIFLICLLSSFTIFFPAPGTVLWLLLVKFLHLNKVLAGVVGSIGGTLGELTAYYVGYAGRAVIAPQYSQRYQMAEKWMRRYGGITLFVFAFTWLPFDVAGLAAGSLKYPIGKFLLFCWAGRLPRHIIEAYVGVSLLDLMLKHLPTG